MHYKFIDLPFLSEIQNSIISQIPEDYKSNCLVKSLPPEMFAQSKSLVDSVETIRSWTDVNSVLLHVVSAKSRLPIYLDYESDHTPVEGRPKDLYSSINQSYKNMNLNIPILNCFDPYIRFLISLPSAKPKLGHWDIFLKYDSNEFIEIARMHLYKAAFFNTNTIHEIINPTDDTMVFISIKFKN
jgi:hypothetical protein